MRYRKLHPVTEEHPRQIDIRSLFAVFQITSQCVIWT
jgi:hypothetical protein